MVLSGLSTKGMNRAYKWILKLLLQSQTFRYVNTISSQFGLILSLKFIMQADISLTLALYPKPRGQSQEKYAIRTMEQNKNDDSKQNHQSFYIPNTISAKTKNLLMT